MKKVLLLIAILTMCMTFSACNKGAGSGAAATSEEPVEAFENAVTYENAQYGFSVQLPSDFAPQNNDEQLEKDRGGKLYIRKGCMVDMQCADKSEAVHTPEEIVSNGIGFCATSDDCTVIERKVEGTEGIVKYQDKFGYRAEYYKCMPDKKLYTISFTYDSDKKKEYDDEVDKIIKSLKVKE